MKTLSLKLEDETFETTNQPSDILVDQIRSIDKITNDLFKNWGNSAKSKLENSNRI